MKAIQEASQGVQAMQGAAQYNERVSRRCENECSSPADAPRGLLDPAR